MTRPIIYKSPYPMPDVPIHQSISQFLLESDPDDAHPDTVILANFDNPSYQLTYGEIRENAGRDAAILKEQHGLDEGDVVCIYAQNSVNWASLAHAVLWAGGCFSYVVMCFKKTKLNLLTETSGINPLATSFELIHYFEVACPKIVAVDASLLQNASQALEELSFAPKLIVIEDGTSASAQEIPIVCLDKNNNPLSRLELTNSSTLAILIEQIRLQSSPSIYPQETTESNPPACASVQGLPGNPKASSSRTTISSPNSSPFELRIHSFTADT